MIVDVGTGVVNRPETLGRLMSANDTNERRIILCPSAYFPSVGGIEEITRTLAQELIQRGFEVIVVTNRFPDQTPSAETLDGVPVRRFSFKYPVRSFGIFGKMLEGSREFLRYVAFIRSFKPDIIHIMGVGPAAIYTVWAQRFCKFRLLVTTHGEFTQDTSAIFDTSAFARWAAQRVLASADAVSACSRYVMDQAAAKFDLPQSRSVIYNGVELQSVERSDTRLAVGELDRYVLGVGRLVANKEFDLLVRSMAELRAEFPDVKLVFAGDGTERSRLEEIAAQCNISDQVIFAGMLRPPEVAHLYLRCEAFVSPCSIEGFGIVCLEAMRDGRPVVVASSGGPTEFIKAGENGLIFESHNVQSLTAALRSILKDRAFGAHMGAKAKETVSQFDRRKVVDQYIQFYRTS